VRKSKISYLLSIIVGEFISSPKLNFMICRIWHGYASLDNADRYASLLKRDVLPGIGNVQGYKGAQLLRRSVMNEVEFIVITYFENMDAIVAFAGKDYTKAVIHAEAAKLLSHFDDRSSHYELIDMVMPGFMKPG
jgi:heme-degrading monooxygenase HmoA